MQYIDIHTHHKTSDSKFVSILNNDGGNISATTLFSNGIHPWNTENAVDWGKLEVGIQKNNCLAVGECGLDKLKGGDLTKQYNIFARQISLANQYEKPLIIHCVRAYAEVQQCLRENKNQMPVIFHGFNKNPILATELQSKGYFLSMGKAVFNTRLDVDGLDLDFLFFETDQAQFKIEEIYTEFAKRRNISTTDLVYKIKNNFKKIFDI